MPSDDRIPSLVLSFTLRYTGPDIDVSETGFRDASTRSSISDMKDASGKMNDANHGFSRTRGTSWKMTTCIVIT